MDKLTSSELDALARIEKDVGLQVFFFKKATNLKWFEPLLERGYFAPQSLPVAHREGDVFTVGYWPQADYLAAASEGLADAGEELQQRVLDVVRSISDHAERAGGSNFRIWWQFAKVLKKIPHTLLSLEDMHRLDYWLRDPVETSLVAEESAALLEGLMMLEDAHADSLSLHLLASLFEIQIVDSVHFGRDTKLAKMRASPFEMERVVQRIARASGLRLGAEAVDIYLRNLGTIARDVKEDEWSYIWRPSIEDHPQNSRQDDPEDIFIEAAKDGLLGLIERDVAEAVRLLGLLYSSDLNLYQRLAIWASNRNDALFAGTKSHLVNEKFFQSNFRHEYWTLLSHRFGQFEQRQKDEILRSIESLVANDDEGGVRVEATAYRRSIWYAAIREFGLEATYQKYVDVAKAEPEHPSFATYSWGGTVTHKSAFTVEELLGLNALQLTEMLNEYVNSYESNMFDRDAPDLEGLAQTVRSAVKQDPIKFGEMLDQFDGLSPPFLYELIEGFATLWGERAQLPWSKIWPQLVNFCDRILAKEEFWAEWVPPGASFVGRRTWIVTSIGRLLESAVRDDERAVDPLLHGQIQNVLLRILDRQDGDAFELSSDAVMVAINSPRGQAIEALINLSLRECRLSDAVSSAWGGYERHFDKELSSSWFEINVLVARYLPNFLYMSKEWLYRSFDQVFPNSKTDRLRWKCAMEGYASVTTVYEGVYERLRDRGHFAAAFMDDSMRERLHEKIVQNVAVAYLSGMEPLDGDLMSTVLANRDLTAHLIWFYWALGRKKDERLDDRFLAIWDAITKKWTFDSRDGRLIASKLCNWIDLVQGLDDRTTEMLAAVVPFADEDHNAYTVLEGIARLAKSDPVRAAIVWDALLSGSTASYSQEAIESALDSLIELGRDGVSRAKQIADRYLKGGNDLPGQHIIRRGIISR